MLAVQRPKAGSSASYGDGANRRVRRAGTVSSTSSWHVRRVGNLAAKQAAAGGVRAQWEQPEQRQARNGRVRAVLDLVVTVAVAVALTFALTNWVVRTYEVPSESMEDTLLVGDCVFSERVSSRASDPQVGDIITFTVYVNPADDSDPYTHLEDASEEVRAAIEAEVKEDQTVVYVKRVVAVAGQVIDVAADGTITVDGEETYQDADGIHGATTALAGSRVEYPYTVPEGEVFVMGDNREDSLDSRWFGSVPLESVTGHVVLRYWPIKRIGAVTASRGN